MEGRPLDETELIEGARRGENVAFEGLMRTHQGIAFRTAYVITGNAADAEDAVQTGFFKAYRAMARFRPGAPFKPWLLKIVANEARNRTRSRRRHEGLELRLVEDRLSGDAAPSPEAAVLDQEPKTELLRVVNGLGERDRLAIAYRYFLDLSEAEMAVVMGCSRGTVKSRLSRAMARLRERLTASGALESEEKTRG